MNVKFNTVESINEKYKLAKANKENKDNKENKYNKESKDNKENKDNKDNKENKAKNNSKNTASKGLAELKSDSNKQMTNLSISNSLSKKNKIVHC